MKTTLTLQPGDALLIVDVQNDFLPGGALAVLHGDEVIALFSTSRTDLPNDTVRRAHFAKTLRQAAGSVAGRALVAWLCIVCLWGLGEWRAHAAEEAGSPPDITALSTPLSTNVTEVIRLSESGLNEEVILAYIENSQTLFGLDADDIIYLNDIGIPSDFITTMLRRDTVLREQGVPAVTPPSEPQVSTPNTTNTPPPVYVTNAPPQVTYFYDTLTPYGTWIVVDGFGWCWQPRIVVIDPHWRPYWHGGRWLYTDSGWYWHSDYSWGWAPFHYGRWHHHHRHGWVWFPDLMWAPAWVSWRFSDVHCGWAPLPPGAHFVIGHGWRFNNVSVGINFDFHLGPDLFTFVELRHLHERRPHLHAIPTTQVKEIHNQTSVINNYVLGKNNRLINHGVAVDKVAAASRREIRPVTIADVPAAQAGVIRRDQLTRFGSTTVLYRPELKTPVKPGPVVAQRIDERHSIVRPTPQRPSVTPPRRVPAPLARPIPPTSVPPATTVLPKGVDNRSIRPAPIPSAPKGKAVRPSAPRPEPVRPVQPTPRVVAPPQPVVPRPPISAPPRHESPKGREQRLSNGPQIQQPSRPPAAPPSSRPPPQKGAESRPPSSRDGKHE